MPTVISFSGLVCSLYEIGTLFLEVKNISKKILLLSIYNFHIWWLFKVPLHFEKQTTIGKMSDYFEHMCSRIGDAIEKTNLERTIKTGPKFMLNDQWVAMGRDLENRARARPFKEVQAWALTYRWCLQYKNSFSNFEPEAWFEKWPGPDRA